MGRKSRARALSVWVNGQLSGEWRIPARGETEFQYDATWVESEEGRPLSLSLPFSLDKVRSKADPVEYYFDNLLPDADPIRKRLQDRFHTGFTQCIRPPLPRFGRDCVGAVQLLPPKSNRRTRMRSVRCALEVDVERALIQTVSPPSFAAHPRTMTFVFQLRALRKRPLSCITTAKVPPLAPRPRRISSNCRSDS